MKHSHCIRIAALIALLYLGAGRASAQIYRNLVNVPFRSVSSGPQSAYILDVKDATDTKSVSRAVQQQIFPQIAARNRKISQELAAIRLRHPGRRKDFLVLGDAIITRQNGSLQTPTNTHRGPGDELTFNIVTSGDGAFTSDAAVDLQNLVNLLYPALRDNILGRPGWTGTITIKNLDPTAGKVTEPVGAVLVVNGNNVEIDFPTFNAYEFRFLSMAQAIAMAFHARQLIAYNAWEIGMARAAAAAAAVQLKQAGLLPAGQIVNPANGYFYTPYYDQLNQPALGNSTFFPPTKSGQPFVSTTLSGMLVPRLQMSSTAWLKCYIENNNFFKRFNTGSDDGRGTGGYYAAFAADSTVANDISRLRTLAAAALPTVELLDFNTWFERQYVLNTSVTVGPKLFVSIEPTFPTGSAQNDSGAALFVVYYTTASSGDETDLSGTANVVYYSFDFANRLSLPSFETVRITNGFGTVAPFFVNIGSNDQQRIAIDVPVNKEYVRVYFPTGQTGLESDPNNFSGVVVGADTGNVSVAFDGGSGAVNAPVAAGEFGVKSAGAVRDGFSRTRLDYTSTAGGTTTSFQRNVYARPETTDFAAVAPLFVLSVPGPTDTLTHTFPAGPQMISFPIRPLSGSLATTLGLDPNQTLLAQYRQDLPGTDKYMRFPSLPLYQPGYALWSNFAQPYTAGSVRGERTDIQQAVSAAIQFGWNQIGTPYNQNINVTSGVTFQYLGGDVLSLAGAIARGYIATGIFAYNNVFNSYEDITSSATQDVNVPLNTLEPWKGYWIRVTVTEGLTMTFTNPSRAAAPNRAADAAAKVDGWRIPLSLRDSSNHVAAAVFGQATRGAETFVASLHAASPPPFAAGGSTFAIVFPHSDWDTGAGIGGEFLSDIRRSGAKSQWDITVTVPAAEQNYTLAWADTAKLPQGTRLTLVDKDSGTRLLMSTQPSYTFRTSRGVTVRHFQILAEPRTVARLRISNVAVVAPQAAGGRAARNMTITYELTQSAVANLEIRLGGRVVRHLSTGRAAGSGVNQTVWDLRDDAGRSLPGGVYALEITAESDAGERTRTITPLQITR